MARGKHKQKSANRRALQHEAKLAALDAEIAAERETLAELEPALREVEAARARLREQTAGRESDSQDAVADLTGELELLERLLRDLGPADEALVRAWRTLWDRGTQHFGGGRNGLEQMNRATGMTGYLIDDIGRMSPGQATRLQKIRGERTDLPDIAQHEPDPHTVTLAWRDSFRRTLRSEWDRVGLPSGEDATIVEADLDPEQVEVLASAAETALTLDRSHVTTLHPDAVALWNPFGWVKTLTDDDATFGPALRELGADGPDGRGDPPTTGTAAAVAGTAVPTPTPALPAASRARVAAADPVAVWEAWRPGLAAGEALVEALGAPHGAWRAGPRHPLPGRAASLRHHYGKAAAAGWMVRHDDGAPDAGTWGEVAVGLVCAAPFWLPAAQTHAFASSEQLSAEDVEDLRLPFPQVFVAFAEPMRLPATRVPAAAEAAALASMDAAVALRRDRPDTVSDVFRAMSDSSQYGKLDVETVLAVRGALVEGVLVLGDALGRVSNRFAWCLQLPSGASGTLGRHVVPADLSATSYRAVVENLVAVAAWADWHAPDAEVGVSPGVSPEALHALLESREFRREADRAGAGGVRVLDVRATVRSESAGRGEPTRQVAPHVRRGHWRRQRFGPGRREVRRVRIAPVLVNAQRGAVAAKVYTLPRAAGGA